MRKVLFILAALTLLSSSAFASTWSRDHSVGAVSTTGTASVATSSSAIQGDLLFIGCADRDGSAMTLSASGWTSVQTMAGNTWANVSKRTVGASEPASYTATGTSGHHIACTLIYVANTDGSTPVVDASAASTSTSATTAVTTTVANDYLLWITFGSFGFTPSPPTAQIISGSPTFLGINAAYAGQGASGASITPTINFSGGVSGDYDIATIAIKSNTTTAVRFVGVGAEQYHSSSANSVAPAVPTNSKTNDILFANINEGTNTGITISTSDVQFRASSGKNQFTGSTSANFIIPTQVVSGDFLRMFIRTGNTVTAPTGWTQIASDTSVSPGWGYIYTAVSGAGGNNNPGDTINWTCSSSCDFRFNFAAFWSASGSTITTDGISLTDTGTSTTATTPSVTTAHASDLIDTMAYNNTGTAPSLPASLLSISSGSGTTSGYTLQDTAGASATFTYSGSSSTWFVGTVALQAGATPWTKIGSSIIDPSSTIELDRYWHLKAASDPATWVFSFASSPGVSDGIILAFGNVNTTTPTDVQSSVALPGMDTPIFPNITPTTADEVLLYLGGDRGSSGAQHINGFAVPVSTIFVGSGLVSAGYGPLAGANVNAAGSIDVGAFATSALGLKAATTPTRTTANAQIDQAILVITSTDTPVSTVVSSWFF